MKKLIIGLTGASGSGYFLHLAGCLVQQQELELHLIATEQGKKVFEYETGHSFEEQLERWNGCAARVIPEDNENLFSPVASGSFRCDAMVILPCSVASAAEIACGTGKTLLARAAEVMLKERRRLVLVVRETPLSSIHLENMLRLSQAGAVILPAMPGFYGKPRSVDEIYDFIAGKALDSLGLPNNCYQRWEGNHEN